MCGHYIRSKLRRAGVLNRKVTQRLRNIIDTPSSSVVREIFPIINVLGDELEKLHVRTYTNISRQLTRSNFHELPELLLSYSEVAKELFKQEITWGKVRLILNRKKKIENLFLDFCSKFLLKKNIF